MDRKVGKCGARVVLPRDASHSLGTPIYPTLTFLASDLTFAKTDL
jgi:hypothetical protein